jgi:hypothetical protein
MLHFLTLCYLLVLQEVHETAAGALWNLAFYSCNSLRIVENGGVPVLVNLCSSSGSKMARFMAALTLAYMFDGRYAVYESWLLPHVALAVQVMTKCTMVRLFSFPIS